MRIRCEYFRRLFMESFEADAILYSITYNISGWHDASYNAFVAPLEQFNITEPFQVTQVA